MSVFAAGAAMALWFGILTSISPCPLATNIAAVSYIGRRLDHTGHVLFAGILYALGRMITYVVLGVFLVSGMESMPAVANFLQKYMNIMLGPFLIIVGAVLADIIPVNFKSAPIFGDALPNRVEKTGVWGAGLLGIIFALSFCPVSAALFFGSLFALAIQHGSKIIMPAMFGIGTALPVLGFAILFAVSMQLVGRMYNRITVFALWARKITALVFVSAGILYCFKYIVPLI
jgi:cytochrome c-type biogenesis protein